MSKFTLVPLGDLAQFINGDRGKNYPSKSDFVEHGIPFINAGHLTNGEVDFTEMNYISEYKFGKIGSGKTKPNDILYCLRGSLGKTAMVRYNGDAAIASSLVIIRPSKNCWGRYLYRYLTSPLGEEEIWKFDTGSSQPNLSATSVKKYQVPLPPLEEQKRIAVVIDKADEIRAKRRVAIEKLNSLLQSVFLDMFGDPVSNPKGWEKPKFGNVFKTIRYGTGSPPPYVSEGIPFIRATNIKKGTVVLNDLKHITEADSRKIEKCRIFHGNLLVVRSGVNSGDCALVPIEFDGAFAAYDLIVEIDYKLAVFYNFLINSKFGKQIIEKLTRRAAQPHLNADQLSNIEFIKPTSNSLTKFVEVHSQIEKLKKEEVKALNIQSQLFQSLQQRAFAGELFRAKLSKTVENV